MFLCLFLFLFYYFFLFGLVGWLFNNTKSILGLAVD